MAFPRDGAGVGVGGAFSELFVTLTAPVPEEEEEEEEEDELAEVETFFFFVGVVLISNRKALAFPSARVCEDVVSLRYRRALGPKDEEAPPVFVVTCPRVSTMDCVNAR